MSPARYWLSFITVPVNEDETPFELTAMVLSVIILILILGNV